MLVFSFELVFEMLQQRIVEILSSQVSITGGGFDSKYATTDIEKRDIKSSSSQVEDENIFLGFGLTVKAVGYGCSSWFIDDTKNVQSRYSTSILGGQTLR